MAGHAAGLFDAGTRALTHCNAGGLATGGYGSAVGALRTAWERGVLERVWVDETRPLLQGSRLTAWELETAGIPYAVIADSAAASLMAAGDVDCVVTGADRIAANGDTANKIGTYSLAVLAAHHDIPFYVVAPTSTVDLATADRLRHSDRRARGRGDHDPFRGAQPGLRRHARRADRGDRDGARRPPCAVCASRSRRSYEGADPRGGLRDAFASAHRLHPKAAAAGRRPADGRLDPRPDRGDECRRDSPRDERAVRRGFRALGRRQGRPHSQRRDDVERGSPRRDRRHPLRRRSTTTCS